MRDARVRECASVLECFSSKGQTATVASPGDWSAIKEDERQTQSCRMRSRLGLNPLGQISPHSGVRWNWWQEGGSLVKNLSSGSDGGGGGGGGAEWLSERSDWKHEGHLNSLALLSASVSHGEKTGGLWFGVCFFVLWPIGWSSRLKMPIPPLV